MVARPLGRREARQSMAVGLLSPLRNSKIRGRPRRTSETRYAGSRRCSCHFSASLFLSISSNLGEEWRQKERCRKMKAVESDGQIRQPSKTIREMGSDPHAKCEEFRRLVPYRLFWIRPPAVKDLLILRLIFGMLRLYF